MISFLLSLRRNVLLLLFGVFLAWATSRLTPVKSMTIVESINLVSSTEKQFKEQNKPSLKVENSVKPQNIINKNIITPITNCVNLNKASLTELETLPGVGEKTANAIVATRPYTKVTDLTKVKGIGIKKLAKLQSKACVY